MAKNPNKSALAAFLQLFGMAFAYVPFSTESEVHLLVT
jgi:hypothetical protein